MNTIKTFGATLALLLATTAFASTAVAAKWLT